MIQARFRFRAVEGQEVRDRHSDVIRNLAFVTWLWEILPKDVQISLSGESASCSLNPYLKANIKGAISYAARYSQGMSDKAIFDDVLTLNLEENAIHYAQFSGCIFEDIVKAFVAYRATIILDLDLDIDDYEDIVELAQKTGKDIDGRDTVYRFNPINYFDDQLCHRAFGFGAEEVVTRLDGEIERAVIQEGGALIIATTDLVDRDNLYALHNHIASLLGIEATN
ncbi:hypothetical protein Mal52_19150 [Symmachiella dynata]|uniref:Uncharacterized protein n=1 Tax=Symmachiella dynata TaxID=2527995 RepID=A0A517ZLS9_9PLAN|nr:hypothetical protein [Symmachiella dynata]QDU43441.1 hypothetical protein Mal52_19150 [Symmachiella dynata]